MRKFMRKLGIMLTLWRKYCQLEIWRANLKTLRVPHVDKVAAILMLRQDGAALLQYRDAKPGLRCAGLWGLPGGHVEPGESSLDCARRELLEETEYEASDLKFLLFFDVTDEYGAAFMVSFFWCRYDGIQPLVCHEGQALAFVTRSEAENFSIPTHVFDIWDRGLAVLNSKSTIHR